MDAWDRADAVVVGAGPAGSAAAVALARAGRRVLLLDRAAFPRDKPCGDLIGVRAMGWARRLGVAEDDLAPYPRLAGALVTADGGALDLTPTGTFGRLALARSDARVIPRCVFDAALVRAAQRAGAELRRVTVRRVEPWDGNGRVVLGVLGEGSAATLRIRARGVVLAGGYGCRVAAEAAPIRGEAEPARGIATRGYFAGVEAPAGRIVFCLDEWVLPGYGWVFPLPGGGANVGVGTLAGEARTGRERLGALYARFTTDAASPAAPWLAGATPLDPPRAWPLDLGPRRRRLVADGLLVAGEAAALVGPLTGAGIAFALESGFRAGDMLAAALAGGDPGAAALTPYATAIGRRIVPWLRAEGVAQRWLGEPARLRALIDVVRPLPSTAALGARLLLHLG